MLLHLDNGRIAVDRRALEAVESYLIALDQMYRVMYFHHSIRAASCLLSSVLGERSSLYKAGDNTLMPELFGQQHPLRALVDRGQEIDLSDYARLGEFHVWSLIELWQYSNDAVLSDLSKRLIKRQLPKAIDVDPAEFHKLTELQAKAKDLTRELLPFVTDETVQYYVAVDTPTRTSYRRYDWTSEGADESIWMTGGDKPPKPIEDEASSIVEGLRNTKYFHRLIFPEEIRERLLQG